jgi:hypothetical protein
MGIKDTDYFQVPQQRMCVGWHLTSGKLGAGPKPWTNIHFLLLKCWDTKNKFFSSFPLYPQGVDMVGLQVT